MQRAIRARDVRAADLQEKPTKRVENRADLLTQSFRRIQRRRPLPGEHRSERSEPIYGASAGERSNQHANRSVAATNESRMPGSENA